MIVDRKDEETGSAEVPAEGQVEPGRRRGCRRLALFGLVAALILLVLVLAGGYRYLGTESFAELIRLRIETTLENRLGREVTIGRVTVTRTLPSKVILQDIRIANAPGGVHPFFAHVREVEIRGGIQSFMQRRVELGRIDVRDPQFFLEIYPEDSPLDHNFPTWKRSKPRSYQIYRLDVQKIFVSGGLFDYNDIRRDMHAQVRNIASEVTAQYSEQIYSGIATSPSVTMRIKDYAPFDLNLRAGYRYEPGALKLESVALRGRGIEAFLSGNLEPVTEAVYDFKLDTRMELARIREIFGLEAALSGSLSIDGTLRGEKGDFELAGRYSVPKLVADAYELEELTGKLTIDGSKALVNIASAKYGGGTISGDYELAEYAEPYPMSIELDYDRVSLEKLFEDWGVDATGLRGAATGGLTYAWNQDKLLEGSGRGDAKLAPGAVAFGQAAYPIPLSGSTEFALDAGTITFARSNLRTPKSSIEFSGKLGIEGLVTDLAVAIDSSDLSELDRIAYNFARTADKDDYELLGFGGAGTITGTVRGPIDAPQVAARIAADGTIYNDVLLGASEIDLAYDGVRSVLTFNRAQFSHEGGTLLMTGTLGFPDSGPGPLFDLRIVADNWDVPRALQIVELELAAQGSGTGSLTVRGTPENGTVTFDRMRIVRSENAYLNLNGDVRWLPGEGNVAFNLDIGATSYPVPDLIAFLDLGELPVTGELTGTLHIEGPKDSLEGAGALMVRGGTIYGEPVEQVTADLVFTEGSMRATSIEVRAAAGTVTGEAEYNFASETFGYTIQATGLDLSKVQALAAVSNFFGGRLTLNSSGGGTLEQPELVVEAVLEDGSLEGAELPEGADPPTFYLAIRNGQMIVRGSAFDVATVEGTGTIAPSGELDGLVKMTVSDIARFITIFAPESGIPAAGTLVADFRLSGSTSSLETIVVEATVPTFDVSIGGQQFAANEPIAFALRDGSVVIDSFSLRRNGSVFDIDGSVGLTDEKAVNLTIDGSVEAAMLQLFVPDAEAEGLVNVAASVSGTLSNPRVNGTAELVNAQLKMAGFPQLISDITGALVFRDQRVEIDSLRASVGGGTIIAGGFVDLEGMQLSRFRVNLQGSEVSLRYFEGVSLAGDFSLLFSGDLNEALLQGEVVVDRAVYSRDFEAGETILNLLLERNRGLVPSVAASWQDKVALRIDLIARDALAIKNNIADITGDADLDVTGTLANPVILGLVEIHEGGTIEFQDVEYTVVRGTINFQNPFRIDPFFDITAEGRVQEYDLTVNLSGTMDRIVPSISSDPPVSGLTLLSLLGPSTIGQGPSQGVSAGSLQGAGTSLLLNSVGGLIGSRIFPFADSFRVDAGQLEGSSSPEPTVTFEKQIDNDLRVIVTYNTADSRKSRQVIEWQVRPEWLLQFTRDKEEEYILEARFRRRYDGRWGNGASDVALTSGPRGGGPSELIVQADEYLPAPPPLAPPEDAIPEALDPGPPEGREFVSSITFRTDSAFDLGGVPDLIPLQAGQRITIRDVRNSISRLYATGDFRDIIVEGETADDTIAVTFVLSVNYRIGETSIEGADDLRSRAEAEVKVREADVLSLAAIDRSAGAIARMLAGRGYLEAVVEPETEFFRETNRADVIFHVELGPEAKIRDISIDGDPEPFTIAELEKVMRLDRGDVFRQSRAVDAAQRLQSHLIRRDYRQARVRFARHEYNESTGTAQLFFTLDLGPKVRVEVEGVPRRSVRRQIPFGRTEPYSEDRLDRASREIIEAYQKRGHYEVALDIQEEVVDDTLVITFEVDPGLEYELREVMFEGNQTVPDKELESLIATSRPGGLRKLIASITRRGTGITRETLGDDRDTIEAYYRLDGFSLAAVEQPEVRTRADGTLDVIFSIAEGPQTIVSGVLVEGAEKVAPDKLPSLQVREGEPLNPTLLEADRANLQAFYADNGYVEHQLTYRVDPSEDLTSATVTYAIAEGPQVLVDESIVRGNTYTDGDVILRVANLEKGKPFSFIKMLEAQRDLYRLGIFRRVDVLPEQTASEVAARDVVVEVEEGKNLTVAGSVGYSTEDGASISGSLAHRNLFGTARYAGVEARVSQRSERFFLTYREPFTFRSDIPTQFTIFKTDETREGARIETLGTFIEASRVVFERSRWALRYEYKLARCAEGDLCDAAGGEIPIPGLPRDEQEIQISSITPSFFWDNRDDPFNPRSGSYASLAIEWAEPFREATAHFLKGYSQGAWYRPVGDRSEIVVSARIGAIEPLADEREFVRVPFSERFVAGGETSHRAFGLDQLGIEGETLVCVTERVVVPCVTGGRIVPTGGNALSLINLEYRFPIFGSLRGALFVDGGNVWSEIDQIDFGEFRYGAGVGVRYLTPVGPIRVDFGYKLDREAFEDPYAFTISLGFPF